MTNLNETKIKGDGCHFETRIHINVILQTFILPSIQIFKFILVEM